MTSPERTEDATLRDELLDRERAGWSGASMPHWYDDDYLARDALLVFPEPTGVLDRSEAIDALRRAGGGWERFRFDDVRALRLGPDVASLTYHAVGRREGADLDYVALVSSVYVRDGDRWRLALHQQTPLPGDAA